MSDSIRDRLKAPAGHGEQAGPGDTRGSEMTSGDFVQTDSRSAHGTTQSVATAHDGSGVSGGGGHLTDDPDRARRAERAVASLFLLAFVGVVGFIVSFIVVPFDFGTKHYEWYTPALGIFMTLALVGVGAGAVLWAKTLMVDEETVQERHHLNSDPEDRAATAQLLKDGFQETGLPRRSLLRNSLLLGAGSLALLPLPLFVDLGKWQHKERTLSRTGWRKGSRLLDEFGRPVKLGDLEVGGVKSVFPDVPGGRRMADSAALLIRMRPEDLKVRESRKDWVQDGHIVYSVICTHLGCPVKLYEQQTHHLFCPCHQSTFDAADGAKVLFGPAARNLPQLAISLDADGYFVAQGDFTEPVGPSFWERKPKYSDKVGN
ncbi:MAG: Rieske 2Fe-2S domain-containing protein [Mycobacteriales bacterium]